MTTQISVYLYLNLWGFQIELELFRSCMYNCVSSYIPSIEYDDMITKYHGSTSRTIQNTIDIVSGGACMFSSIS